jgi:hypothetical protein
MLLVLFKRLRSCFCALFIMSLLVSLSAEGVKSTAAKKKTASESTAAEMPAMPEPPVISSLSMPTISAPTIGSSFYTPGITGTTSSANQDAAAASGTQATVQPTSPTAATVQSTALSSAAAAGSLSSSVTAADLSSLDGAGLLNSLYSSMNSQGSGSSSETNTMLSNILQQLNDIKAENKSTLEQSSAEKNAGTTNGAVSRSDCTQPAILRFTVNGYNVLATCRTIYFSDCETDGSFLLTGDRKYTSDGKTRAETFYLLFKAKGSAGSSTQYSVEPAVVQDYPNAYSFVYQLAQKDRLSAAKTGNLITMRVNAPSYNMDLLIDTGTKQNK